MTAPRTLEDKQAEKGRLWKAYRAGLRQQWQELCEREPRLPALRRAIRRTQTPWQAINLIADSWVRESQPDIQHIALRTLDRHAWKMALSSGRGALDDPIPPGTSVFFIAKEMLNFR